MAYHPEAYWSRVAGEVRKRGSHSDVAGDDNPFFRYKREKFLARFLGSIDFRSKTVLEIGPGPGGNLLQVVNRGAQRAIGIDISTEMLALAAETLKGHENTIQLLKSDGEHLPLPDNSVDLTFTVTVLQHNTDPTMFENLLAEMCRVTKTTIILMEDTGKGFMEPGRTWIGRRSEVYEAACLKYGFRIQERRYLGLAASRMAHGLVSRLLVTRDHLEGEPFGALPVAAMKLLLTFTKPLDDVLPDTRDLTRMVFVRETTC